ncbi:hypothetical protein AX14_002507 [Amanita brunnescens Koide BX004]|nr:hypothetical protein AX14_002507 [Amanita brunnescens Koide BX004]
MIFFHVLLFCTLGTFAVAAPLDGFLWKPHPTPVQCLPTTFNVLFGLHVKVDMEQALARMTGYWRSEDRREGEAEHDVIYINLSSFDVVHPAKGLGKPPKASDVFRKLRRWERVPRDKYKEVLGTEEPEYPTTQHEEKDYWQLEYQPGWHGLKATFHMINAINAWKVPNKPDTWPIPDAIRAARDPIEYD